MTVTPTPDHRFEDRLLSELRQVVAQRPEPAGAAAPGHTARGTGALAAHGARRRRYTRGALAGTGATVAAAAGVLVLAQGGSPAFAVDAHDDGSVSVTINSVRDAAGLQAKLIAAGIPAVVDYVPEGKTCAPGRFTVAPLSGVKGTSQSTVGSPQGGAPGGEPGEPGGPTTFTVGKDEVGPGETLVLTNTLGSHSQATSQAIASGTVKPCELIDATSGSDTGGLPPLPAGESGKSTGHEPKLVTHELPGSGAAPAPTTP